MSTFQKIIREICYFQIIHTLILCCVCVPSFVRDLEDLGQAVQAYKDLGIRAYVAP